MARKMNSELLMGLSTYESHLSTTLARSLFSIECSSVETGAFGRQDEKLPFYKLAAFPKYNQIISEQTQPQELDILKGYLSVNEYNTVCDKYYSYQRNRSFTENDVNNIIAQIELIEPKVNINIKLKDLLINFDYALLYALYDALRLISFNSYKSKERVGARLIHQLTLLPEFPSFLLKSTIEQFSNEKELEEEILSNIDNSTLDDELEREIIFLVKRGLLRKHLQVILAVVLFYQAEEQNDLLELANESCANNIDGYIRMLQTDERLARITSEIKQKIRVLFPLESKQMEFKLTELLGQNVGRERDIACINLAYENLSSKSTGACDSK